MENFIKKFLKFHWKRHKWLTLLIGGAAVIVFILILQCIWAHGYMTDLIVNLVASLVAFLLAYLIALFITRNLMFHEDEIKASYLNSNLQPQYNPKGENKNKYRKSFYLHNEKDRFIVYVEALYRQYKDTNHLFFLDDKDSYFEPDPFIMMHVGTLYGAHATSKTVSELTVRLNDFKDDKNKDNKAIAFTTRSTYLAHLLTNRAIDYPLEEDITVRKIFENTEFLTPLNRSKLSNHIGVNALIFLTNSETEEKYLILPKRGKDATVAKKGVTASIATRLNLKNYEQCFSGTTKQVDESTISQACVIGELTSALMIKEEFEEEMQEKLKKKENMHFLGLSRDPYEGGKPTLFYYIELEMTKEEFISKLNPKYEPKGIDAVHELLFVPWENVGITNWEENIKKRDANPKAKTLSDSERLILEDTEYDQSRLLLKKPDHYSYSKKEKRYTFTSDKMEQQFIFEQNLIANLWFYVNKDKTDDEIQSQLY